ncbi:MAG: pitrilysin family protein [Proteobacteria bacterium]|nr:pitrilysin family protein [Pseudomonadota bacterium]
MAAVGRGGLIRRFKGAVGQITIGLTAALILGASTAQAETLFNSHEYTLENGLHLVVIEDHRAPIVTHMAWYRVGAIDEYSGKTGLAHFLEHLMFKGTEKVPAGAFSKTVARNGGRDNAFTSSDYTAYYQLVAADKLPLVMEMEADRMNGLVIAEGEVLQERDVVIEERRSRVENSPIALFREQMDAAQFLAHPYRVPVIGWMHDIETLTRDDALGFYRIHYAPNNAVVIVVGDVNPDAVRDLAEQTYGALPAKEIPARIIAQEPPQRAPRQLIMRDPRVAQVNWSRAYLAPSYGYGNKDDAVPLTVLKEILGGSTTSRLYQDLVVKQKIAIDVSSWYRPQGIGPSTIGVGVTPVGDDATPLDSAVDTILADIMAHGVTPEELARAQRSLTAAAIYARDDGQSLANTFGAALITGRTVADIEAWPDKVRAVTNDDIMTAARNVFVPEQSVTGLLMPDRRLAEAAQ